MSAPATALAIDQPTRRPAAVRLADVAAPMSCLSLLFGLLLIVFPVSFPHLVLRIWENGYLTVGLMALTLALDAAVYIRIVYRMAAKPSALAAVFLGSLPIIIVTALSFLLHAAIAETLAGALPSLQDRITNEVLAHTFLGLLAGIFLPFLVVRLLQPAAPNRAANSL